MAYHAKHMRVEKRDLRERLIRLVAENAVPLARSALGAMIGKIFYELFLKHLLFG
jgi:hypothetical protein